MAEDSKKLGQPPVRTLSPGPGPPPAPAPTDSIRPHQGSHRPGAPLQDGPVFPRATSTVVPDPSRFFAPALLAAPLPTNSFQNFVLKDGDMPEYIHPHSVRSPGGGALDVCYPSRSHSPSSVTQTFVSDAAAAAAGTGTAQRHVVSAFDDLSD